MFHTLNRSLQSTHYQTSSPPYGTSSAGCRGIICSDQGMINVSANKSILGLQVSILALALISFFGETQFGVLGGTALLYGSYLVGKYESDR